MKIKFCGIIVALLLILPHFTFAEEPGKFKNALYPGDALFPAIVAMEMGEGFGIGLGYERALSNHFSVKGDFMIYAMPEFAVLFGAATGRYYFSGALLKGAYVGLGMTYLNVGESGFNLFIFGPAASAGYKWRIGKNFFIEPELTFGVYFGGLNYDFFSYFDIGQAIMVPIPILHLGWTF